MRVLRKRIRTKTINRPTPPLSLTLRMGHPLGSGTHARYSVVVSEAGINRAEWATVVAELIARETRGKKLPFARRIGVDATTVSRWLKSEVAVKEESVRAVARAFDLQAIDLLVRVGYYEATDLAPPAIPDPYQDPVIMQILADRALTEVQRAELVQHQLDRIEEDLKRRRDEYERVARIFRRGQQQDAS